MKACKVFWNDSQDLQDNKWEHLCLQKNYSKKINHTYDRSEKSSKEETVTLWCKNAHEAHKKHHGEPLPFQGLSWQEIRHRYVNHTEH